MTRPQIIRADTLDLQNHEAPSAKDHNSPNSPPLDSNGLAPSQAHAIMNVVQEQAHDQHGIIANGANGNHKSGGSHYSANSSHRDDLDGSTLNGLDDDDDEDDEETDEDMLDKMSSSPSITDEDIDFEFVYALHTFIATVEGQANATKGDTMVLLDDSNSYWWLVRVVKDSSIGYLPAEHIETPSERLARLNKHRNVDLSTPMLGDEAQKSKNPLKKAMKRRNAKTVNFAPPTYHEASEVDYSSDEEEGECGYYSNDDEGAALDDEEEETIEDTDESNTNPRAQDETKATAANNGVNGKVAELTTNGQIHGKDDEGYAADKDIIDETKGRNGLKHPDSGFFSDSTEPRRIILTPQLLRDEGVSTTITSTAAPVKPKTSLDKIERVLKREDSMSPPPAGKDKEKDKKPKKSMLGSLFKKRSKKPSKEEEVDEFLHYEKRSSESLRDEQRTKLGSRDGSRNQQTAPPSQKQISQTNASPSGSPQLQQGQSSLFRQAANLPTALAPAQSTQRTIRTIDADSDDERPFGMRFAQKNQPVDAQQSSVRNVSPTKASPAAAQNLEKASSQQYDNSPQMSTPSMKSNHTVTPILSSAEHTPHLEHRYTDSLENMAEDEDLPPLIVDTSSSSEENNLPEVSPVESNIDTRNLQHQYGGESSTPTPNLAWSDASLRSYFDDENNDVRNFLVLVNDKSEVAHVDSHPEIVPLFADANSQLKDLTNRLDGMLGAWLQGRRPKV